MKKKDCYFTLAITAKGKEATDKISEVFNLQGNNVRDVEWSHVLMQNNPLSYKEIIELFIGLISDHIDELKQNDLYHGVALFIEYFSEDDLGMEVDPDLLLKLGTFGITLCINHILMYPSVRPE